MTAIGFVLVVVAVFAANSPLALLQKNENLFFAIQVILATMFLVGMCLITIGIAKFLWEAMP